MTDRIEVSKLVGYAQFTAPEDVVTVPKLVGYALVEPGSSGEDTSNRQGHVYVQIVRG